MVKWQLDGGMSREIALGELEELAEFYQGIGSGEHVDVIHEVMAMLVGWCPDWLKL